MRLKKASGKPLEDASEILYNAMDKIMEGDLEPDEDDLEGISQKPSSKYRAWQHLCKRKS